MTLSLPFFTRFLVRAVSLLVLSLGASLLAQGQTIRYVKPTGTGNGSSWANASGNLQAMIIASAATDQVWVAAGMYKPTTTTDRYISFSMKVGVAIYGGFMGTETNLSARPGINPVTGNPSSTTLSGEIGNPTSTTDNSYHVIKNSSELTNTAVLDGFVITGGNADGDSKSGGGMRNVIRGNGPDDSRSISPLIRNCLFQANSASSLGGAIANESSDAVFSNVKCSPTLINCSFQANSASQGGAIGNDTFGGSTSSPTLINCSFKANSAGDGGAMYNLSYGPNAESSPTLTNCSFEANTAVIGGAMRNRAINGGGGVAGGNCSPILINCSFLNNRATTLAGVNNASGGAMSNDAEIYSRCIPRLTNCSFQGNLALGGAGTRGGAISNSGTQDRNCATILTNCVLFGNGGDKTFYSGDNNRYTFVFASYTVLDASVINYMDSGGNTRVTASPFANVTSVALAANSPAINAGDPTTTTATVGATDLAGNPRIVGCKLDMGALEFQYTYLPLAINAQPATSSVVCAGTAVSVPVSVSGTVQGYQWYKDSFANPVAGQNTATLTLSNLQPGNAGSYSLVVTSTCNSLTTTAFNLTVNSLPPVSISPGSATLCQGKSVLLTASGASTYTWSNNTTGNTLSATTAGTYSVTGVDGNGCANTATATITENKPPVSISPGSVSICQGQSALLTASGASTYTWSNNTTGSTLSATLAGTYSVTGVDGNGCSNTAIATVTMYSPTVSISPSSVSICQGQSALLTASGASTYTWSNNTTGNTLSTTIAGTYSVTGVDGNGCSNTAMASVTVNAAPSLTITASPSATITQGNSVTLTLSATGATSFTWSTGSTSSSIVVSPTTSATYSAMARSGAGCVASASLAITTTPPTCGSVIYVTQQGAGQRDGSSWDNALGDNQLQIAIDAVAGCGGNGQVWVAAGVYKPTTGIDRNASFALKNGVSIYGGFAGTETALTDRPAINPVAAQPSSTTLSGNIGTVGNSNDNSFHVINNLTGLTTTAVLDGFVITGGAGGTQGGGMYNDGSSPTIRNCSFVGNSVSGPGSTTNQGGAMANTNSSSPQLTNCVFQSNLVTGSTTNQGGAMANTNSSSPQLTNCVFQSNSATGSSTNFSLTKRGGAMANTNSSPKLINCAFLSNSASGSGNNLGGAMYNNVGNSQLTNCSFLGNSASVGRAVYNISSSPKLINCVVFGNGGSSTFSNSGSSAIPSSIGATYSLFDNTVTGYSTDPTNLTTSTSPFVSSTSVSLAANSPAIDAGLNSAAGLTGISTDLAGNPRLVGCRVDMGAIEFQGTTDQTFSITGGPASASVVCVGSPLTVPVGVSGTAIAYQWYKDNFANPVAGQTSATLALTNVQPVDGGSYSLVVTGACNSLTSTAFSLTVNSPPTVATAGISQTITTGTGATLAANTPTLGRGSWSVVSGPAVDLAQFSNVNHPAAVFTPAGGEGTYSLMWTLANAPCTPSSSSLTITVIPANTPPVATVNANQTATVGTAFSYAVNAFTDDQTPNSLTYTASISPANGLSFDPVTRVISGTPVSTLVSSVTITATDAGGLSASTTFSITASCPPLKASISGALTVCAGQSTDLTASGGTTYVWNTGAITPTISATAGTYSVTVVTTSGCSATATATVSANPVVAATLLPASSTLTCASPSVTLTAGGGSAYRFSVGASQLNGGNTATVNTAGTYSVTVTSANGCTATATTTVTGDQTPPTASLNNDGPLSCTKTSVTLTAGAGTGLSYRFSNGATQINGGNTASVTTAGPYSVTVTGANGCTATASTTVTGDQTPPTAGLTNDGPLTCLKTSVTLTAAGGGTYRFSNGASQIGNGPTATVNTAGPYSVTVTSASGCTATAATTVVGDQSGPTASLNNDGPLSCTKTSVTLTASGGGTYRFSAGASQIGSTNQASVNMAGTYSVTVTNGSGCTATAATTVTGDQTPPTAGLTNDGPLSCLKTSVTLTASGGGTYRFSAGANQVNGGNTASVTTAGPYSVTVTSANGCTATASTTVTGDQTPPTASLSNDGPLSCLKTSVTLTAGAGAGLSYRFSNGASQINGGNTASVTTAGPYSVTVTGANGCTATASTTVMGDQTPPTAGLTNDGPLTCLRTSVTLTAAGGGTYRFSNGASQIGNGPTATVNTAGPYSVTVTSASGCTATAATTVVGDQTPPTASLNNDGPLSCTKTSVTLTAGAGTGLSYRFSNGATQIGSTNQASVTTAGTYSVTVTSANGCTATATTTVVGDQAPPTAGLTNDGPLTCLKTSVTLSASGGGTYRFSNGASQINGGNTATVNTAGTYSVTVTSANGCTATASTTVEENKTPPVAGLTNDGPLTCSKTSATLTANAGTGLSYRFSNGASQINGGNTASVNMTGTYSVTVSNGSGCTATASTTLGEDKTPPTASLSNNGPLSAAMSSVTLTAAPGGVAYAFSAGASQPGGSSGNTATVTTPGTYSVIITGANGCTAAAAATVTTTATPTSTQTVCRNSRLVLTTAQPAARYEWYKNGQTAANKLTDIASIQVGTTTASLTLVSLQTSATYYVKEIQASGSFTWSGPFSITVDSRCTARMGLDEPGLSLSVQVAPNPLAGGQLQASVRGAEGGPLTVQLVDARGYVVQAQHWPQASPTEAVSWDVSAQPAGVYILQALTRHQRQTAKVLKL